MPATDVTGTIFGLFRVLGRAPTPGYSNQAHWDCECPYGHRRVICGNHLRTKVLVCIECKKAENPPKAHEATFVPLPVTPTSTPATKPAKPPKLTKAQRYVLATEERVQQLIKERGIVEYLSTLCDPSDPELRALRRIAERKGTPYDVYERITKFIWLMTTHERQR
jgi:hypothetical protein